MKRNILIKLLAALTVGGLVFAMAATLSVSSGGVGAGDTTVASCDTDGVSTAYTTAWDATDKRYEITTVTVGGLADACDDKTIKVSLTDSTGASIGAGTAANITVDSILTDTTEAVTLTTAPSAARTTGVHVTIG